MSFAGVFLQSDVFPKCPLLLRCSNREKWNNVRDRSGLNKQTLEKFYHKMLERSSQLSQTFVKVPKKPDVKDEILKKIYLESGRVKRHDGMISRTRIYSISSQRYLSVYGSLVMSNGTKDSDNSVILMENVGFRKVRLRGEKSGTYVCFNRKGKLTGQHLPSDESDDDCSFRPDTTLPNYYTSFQSVSNLNFWIGARATGSMKKGSLSWSSWYCNDNGAIVLVIKFGLDGYITCIGSIPFNSDC
eukprot:gene19997-21957_t